MACLVGEQFFFCAVTLLELFNPALPHNLSILRLPRSTGPGGQSECAVPHFGKPAPDSDGENKDRSPLAPLVWQKGGQLCGARVGRFVGKLVDIVPYSLKHPMENNEHSS
jgi:hypothetical protein